MPELIRKKVEQLKERIKILEGFISEKMKKNGEEAATVIYNEQIQKERNLLNKINSVNYSAL